MESSEYGNEYVVFGAARNPREYSLDCYYTSLPIGNKEMSIVDEFMKSQEAQDAALKWSQIVNRAQGMSIK